MLLLQLVMVRSVLYEMLGVRECFYLFTCVDECKVNMAMKRSLPERTVDRAVLFFAATAIIASAFHFWPFSSSPLWKLLNVSHLSIIAGVVLLVFSSWLNKPKRIQITQYVPPLSIWTYLILHMLSCAYADTLSRPAMYTIKMSLMMIGGYLLLAYAFSKFRIQYMPWVIIIACSISILACFSDKFILKGDQCGFFENAYKYGTYTAIMASFAVVYLMSGRSVLQYAAAFILLFTSGLTFNTLGGWAGMLSGLIAGFILCRKECRWRVIGTGILTFLVTTACLNVSILQDFEIKEKDGENLRQRYIEWQAEMNMLQTYSITGSGAGSINDHRSHYYNRLPKLNTLQPFDQNGWLAIPAETGILGLIGFVWIIIEHGGGLLRERLILSAERKQVNAALLAALVASCVSNMFSSVHYHGILICFVTVLAMSKSSLDKGA